MTDDNEDFIKVQVEKSEVVKTKLGWAIRAKITDGGYRIIGLLSPYARRWGDLPKTFSSKLLATWQFFNMTYQDTSGRWVVTCYDLKNSKEWPEGLVIKKILISEDPNLPGFIQNLKND